jgi:thiol-disulfide isomerase/thioredoxin
MLCKVLFTTCAALTLATAANAQVDTGENTEKPQPKPLTIGDPAPSFDISHWIKGDKVSKFQTGNVYVLEFWATWCGPCRMSIPHLSDVQEQFKDYKVTVIGVSDEPLETVNEFLGKKDKEGALWSSKVKYTLATDPDKSVKNDFWTAAGQNNYGIPSAFIIGKDTKVEWIGHPMELEGPLSDVVHDKWDRAAFKKQFEADLAAAKESRQFDADLRDARKAGDLNRALELLNSQLTKYPDNFSLQFQKFVLLAADMNEPKKASAYADEIAQANWAKPMPLNQLAWTMVDAPTIKKRDLDLALKIATRAVELTNGEDGAILDTLARVYYEKGDLSAAVRIQKKAVEHAQEGMADSLKETLKKYETELSTGK